MSITAAAEALRISRTTAYKKIDRRDLRTCKVAGHTLIMCDEKYARELKLAPARLLAKGKP